MRARHPTHLHDEQCSDKRPCFEVPDLDKPVLTPGVHGIASDNKRENCSGIAIERMGEPGYAIGRPFFGELPKLQCNTVNTASS